MAIRFPGSAHEYGIYGETFGGLASPGTAISGASSEFVSYSKVPLFCAPSRYSEVRKVAFWATVRHEHNGSTPLDTFQLEILPDVSAIGGTEIDNLKSLPASSAVTLASMLGVSGPNVASIYGTPSARNTVVPAQIAASSTNGHSGLIYVEYERFSNDAGSIKFFQDWDEMVASGDEDGYTNYRPLIKRTNNGDGTPGFSIGTGSNHHPPQIASFGMCIVQTGAANNEICTYLGTGRPVIDTQDDLTTSYSTNALEGGFLEWKTSEWDGVDSVHLLLFQSLRDGTNNNGQVSVKLQEVEAGITAGPLTDVAGSEEALGSGTSASEYVYRSKDMLALLEDGKNYCVNIKQDGTGNTDRPLIYWEIVQTNATKSVARFQPIANQFDGNNIGSPPEFGRGATLFDPLWFEDLADARFLAKNFQGSFFHGSATNDPSEAVVINAMLGENPVTSSFNTEIIPEITDTPSATAGYKLGRTSTTSTNPVDLAGRRQLIARFKGSIWISGNRVRPGLVSLDYALDLPDSETLGIGPVFELDAFNPEGCASTSAGLGDNPGVLAITNGSTPPKKFDPRAQLISNLGIQTPFCDEIPSSLVEDTSASPTGGVELGTYVYRYTLRNSCTGKESDPNPDDITVDTSTASPRAKVTLSFAGVSIPVDPQVDQICVYRTSNGGAFPVLARIGCFDISGATTFVDETADSELDFSNFPLSILNGFAPCAPIVAEFRNRLFLMGDIPQLSPEGTVDVVTDSDEMTFSSDADVDRCMVGRFIQLEGDCKAYEIDKILPSLSASPSNMRVKLTEPYEGASSTANKFIICGHPNRIYVSEPLEPDYWPAANFIDVEPGDGDRIIGAISNFNGLIICKRRKTYVLRFSTNPVLEVNVPARVSSDIGCIAPRTFAQIASRSVWLSDRGLAQFDGRGVSHVPESDVNNDIFINPDNPNYVRRDRNGRVIGAIGVFYPKREQYLLLLPTVKTTRGASLMLVWDTSLQNITFYEFCQEFVSMEVAKDAEGNERVYLGDSDGFVWIFDIGDTDGVGLPNATGTVRGTVTSAGVDASGASFLSDSSASFLAGGLPGAAGLSGVAGLSGFSGTNGMALAGSCVFVRPAGSALDTPWVSRKIFASTQGKLYVTPSWGDDQPAAGDDYMIGPIEWIAEFKPRNYDTDDYQKRDWQQVITHIPESVASKVRVELIPDFQNSDEFEDNVIDPVTQDVGEGRALRMDFSKGRQIMPVGRNIHNYMQVRMKNFAPEEPVQILNHMLRLTPKTSR